MIEINLLPEELKAKTKEKIPEQVVIKTDSAFGADQLFIFALPVVIGVFFCAHLYFVFCGIAKNSQLVSLNKQWLNLLPQKKVSDEFNREHSLTSQDAGLTQGLVNARVLWAEKLNKLSLNLPSGIWFDDITVNAKSMIIRGEVVSLDNADVTLINKFLDNLRADNEFTKDFASFELNNVQQKTIGSYEVSDFTINGVLKVK